MPTVNITVAGMEKPKPGKERGRIKDKDGVIYQIKPVLMAMMNMDSAYEITYEDQTYTPPGSSDILKFRVINSLTPAIGGASAPPAAPRAYNPTLSTGTHNDDKERQLKDERIAALAILKTKTGEIGDMEGSFSNLKLSALAWRKFLKWQKSVSSDMDGDEVPYDR
jgi:hypothetical protein